MRLGARTVSFTVSVSAIAVVAFACGGKDGTSASTPPADAALDRSSDATSSGDGAVDANDAEPIDAIADATDGDAPSGACNVRLDAPPVMASPHVPDGTAVVYNSNPPSSGPHYPVWANFQEFAQPVDDGYLVHSLEHGAVLLLYRCDLVDGGACADVVAALRAVRDAVPTDPLCDPAIRVRIILAPRPANDVAVAASAWGNTYRADCVDAPSLAQFIADHYAKSPENVCAAGSTF